MYTEQNGELPAIAVPEAGARQQGPELMGPAAPELRNSPMPNAPAGDPAGITAAPPAEPPAITPASGAQDPVQAAPSVPAVADDVDLIEKEWVDKAKQIIEMTRNEPFAQKQEMSRLTADYLQKRYNKSVKVDNAS